MEHSWGTLAESNESKKRIVDVKNIKVVVAEQLQVNPQDFFEKVGFAADGVAGMAPYNPKDHIEVRERCPETF